MTNDDGGNVTIGEVTRGLAALSEQIHRLHEETSSQHHRVRNDFATAVGTIHNDLKTMGGRVEGHNERLHAHGREIGAITKDIDDLRAAHAKLLWAVIGAYGSITLAVLGVVLSRAA